MDPSGHRAKGLNGGSRGVLNAADMMDYGVGASSNTGWKRSVATFIIRELMDVAVDLSEVMDCTTSLMAGVFFGAVQNVPVLSIRELMINGFRIGDGTASKSMAELEAELLSNYRMNKPAYYTGKILGNLLSMGKGYLEISTGLGSSAIAAIAAPFTGGASAVAVPVSLTLAADGVVTTMSSVVYTAEDMAKLVESVGSGGGGSGKAPDEEEKAKLSDTADTISENAQNGYVKRGKSYHGRLSQELEQDILSDPDAVYVTNNNKRNFVFRKGGDVVIVESKGSAKGNVITSYGESGPRGSSSAAIFGGEPGDLGMPVTHDDIISGKVLQPGGGNPSSSNSNSLNTTKMR